LQKKKINRSRSAREILGSARLVEENGGRVLKDTKMLAGNWGEFRSLGGKKKVGDVRKNHERVWKGIAAELGGTKAKWRHRRTRGGRGDVFSSGQNEAGVPLD